ncbi:putative olfactory receptor 4P4-like [Sesbania bispinosa]|nr:putative olfactory receptor 4P4-like [Sesbania bispinosa]
MERNKTVTHCNESRSIFVLWLPPATNTFKVPPVTLHCKSIFPIATNPMDWTLKDKPSSNGYNAECATWFGRGTVRRDGGRGGLEREMTAPSHSSLFLL